MANLVEGMRFQVSIKHKEEFDCLPCMRSDGGVEEVPEGAFLVFLEPAYYDDGTLLDRGASYWFLYNEKNVKVLASKALIKEHMRLVGQSQGPEKRAINRKIKSRKRKVNR